MGPMLLHNLLDRRARRSPHRVAVRQGGLAWTYQELRRRSLGYAAWLRRRGVGRGDRVLVIAPHAAATVPVLYAASRLGALYVVVSDQLRPYLLDHLLSDCQPRLVLVDETGGAVVAAASRAGVPVHPLAEVAADLVTGAAGPPLPATPCLTVDPVSLIYTSGSTALPKAVVSSHAQVLFAARAIASQLRYRPDDVVYCCLPLSFDYGLYQIFLACLAGAQLVVGQASDAGPPLLGRLPEYAVTVLPVVPSLAAALALLVARAGIPPARLRMVTSTGAVLPEDLIGRLQRLVPGLTVVPMFGLTECKRVSIRHPLDRAAPPGSVGRPLPGTEAFVVDEAGRRLPPGEVGELVVRGPHVMSGYWRAPELTATRFRRDAHGAAQLHTGDFCRLDADGCLFFAGRRDELYKQRGQRISAVEVEAAALNIAGVELAALLPPAADRGAVLVVAGGLTPAEVRAQLGQRLEEDRLPDECLVRESLPLQPNGKIDKRALASLLAPVALAQGVR